MIRSLLSKRSAPTEAFTPVAPDRPVLVVGDLHGRADLLRRFLRRAPDFPIVCVGDYVDRGDQSAEVLRLLNARPDITCISGNHEDMMLKFIQKPEENGARWLRYGGLQTLASFGVSDLSEASRGRALTRARDSLVAAMGQDLLSWLTHLPTRWQSGNVAVVHAGADPELPLVEQSKSVLHWGHPNFEKKTRNDGVWVVHGHTIVSEGQVGPGRIAIDTGAYATGKLTVALIGKNAVHFEHV